MPKIKQQLPLELHTIVANDPSLNDKENESLKLKYLAMASLFEGDFLKNINRDSLELSEIYSDVAPQDWLSFLAYTPVKKFIDGFLNEKAEKQAMKSLGENQMRAGDALKVKADIDSRKERVDNSNIVVWFLPQKDYNFGDGNDGNL